MERIQFMVKCLAITNKPERIATIEKFLLDSDIDILVDFFESQVMTLGTKQKHIVSQMIKMHPCLRVSHAHRLDAMNL